MQQFSGETKRPLRQRSSTMVVRQLPSILSLDSSLQQRKTRKMLVSAMVNGRLFRPSTSPAKHYQCQQTSTLHSLLVESQPNPVIIKLSKLSQPYLRRHVPLSARRHRRHYGCRAAHCNCRSLRHFRELQTFPAQLSGTTTTAGALSGKRYSGWKSECHQNHKGAVAFGSDPEVYRSYPTPRPHVVSAKSQTPRRQKSEALISCRHHDPYPSTARRISSRNSCLGSTLRSSSRSIAGHRLGPKRYSKSTQHVTQSHSKYVSLPRQPSYSENYQRPRGLLQPSETTLPTAPRIGSSPSFAIFQLVLFHVSTVTKKHTFLTIMPRMTL